MREVNETAALEPEEVEIKQPKHLEFGRFYAAWTFVTRDWWEFHVLPCFDITSSRLFAGWLFFAIQYTWRNERGAE